MATTLAAAPPAPALGPPRPEFLPRAEIGPHIDPILVHPGHPTESVAAQIGHSAEANAKGEGLIGLRMVDAKDNVYEVTGHSQESRTKETLGKKGVGFLAFKGVELFGGPGIIGNARVVKSEQEVADMRTVRVTSPDGVSTKYLHFSSNEAFSDFLNYNTPDPHAAHGGGHDDAHGHHAPLEPPEKVRLRTPEPPVGFKEFGWQEDTLHHGTGDTIPVPADPDGAVSVAALEAQRERLDKDTLVDVTWTDAHGRSQKIVWDGVESESQVPQKGRTSKLPRDLRNAVTYGNDVDPHNEYLNAKRNLRTVKVATEYTSPEHPDPLDRVPRRHFIQRYRKKSAAKILPDQDPGGNTFVRLRTMTLDELQSHFNAIATERSKDPHSPATDPRWELTALDPSDTVHSALRQEELHMLRAAGIPAHLGRFALAPVVATMPSREIATDPGVSWEEALGLLLSPDFVASGDIPEADWRAKIAELMDPHTSGPEGIRARTQAQQLKETIDELGSEAVGREADRLLKDLRNVMTKNGMRDQSQQLSISWAYKKLADRHTTAKALPHETRAERPDQLTPGDPFEPTQLGRQVRRELIDVEVGNQFAYKARKLGLRQQYDPSTGGAVNVPYYIVDQSRINALPSKIQNHIRNKLSQDPSQPLDSLDLLEIGSLLDTSWNAAI